MRVAANACMRDRYTRGKGAETDRSSHGSRRRRRGDALDWFAAQPWSYGRVLMYGFSYRITAWAAAKRMPTALKRHGRRGSRSGDRRPMEGNVAELSTRGRSFTKNNRCLDTAT